MDNSFEGSFVSLENVTVPAQKVPEHDQLHANTINSAPRILPETHHTRRRNTAIIALGTSVAALVAAGAGWLANRSGDQDPTIPRPPIASADEQHAGGEHSTLDIDSSCFGNDFEKLETAEQDACRQVLINLPLADRHKLQEVDQRRTAFYDRVLRIGQGSLVPALGALVTSVNTLIPYGSEAVKNEEPSAFPTYSDALADTVERDVITLAYLRQNDPAIAGDPRTTETLFGKNPASRTHAETDATRLIGTLPKKPTETLADYILRVQTKAPLYNTYTSPEDRKLTRKGDKISMSLTLHRTDGGTSVATYEYIEYGPETLRMEADGTSWKEGPRTVGDPEMDKLLRKEIGPTFIGIMTNFA